MNDRIFLGIVPNFNFRFAIADITSPAIEASKIHELEPEMSVFLSKTMLGALFLAELTKDKQRVSIQWKDDSKKSVLAYSDRFGRMKAVAYPGELNYDDIRNQFILGLGILKVIRWEEDSNFYQSFTNLIEDTFEANFIKYIEESEQIRTFVFMDVQLQDPLKRAKGIMFQALPEATESQIASLEQKLQRSLQTERFWNLEHTEMLKELTMLLEDDLQILSEEKTVLQCDCSRHKVMDIIVSLGSKEASSILDSEGKIEITCEFCKVAYQFDHSDIEKIF